MAILHRTQIVQTVSQSQRLRIGHVLANLLHATVNVTEYGINLANHFTFECHTEVKYTVGRRVLRTNIHYVVIGLEDGMFHLFYLAVSLKHIFVRHVAKRFVGHTKRIVLFRFVILTEGITHPVFTHEEAAHVGMACKDNAIEVIHLTLVRISNVPKVAY